jgi:Pilus formation protein N terminal region
MMRLAILGFYLGLISAAWAQPESQGPEVIDITNNISVGAGQAQKIRLPTAFDNIFFGAKDIVEATPLTDRVLILQGLAPGQTIMIARKDGVEVYAVNVDVTVDPGRVVRVYGQLRRDDVGSKDYLSYYCTDTGCGRADKELNGAREPSAQTTTVGDDGTVTKTRTYGK